MTPTPDEINTTSAEHVATALYAVLKPTPTQPHE